MAYIFSLDGMPFPVAPSEVTFRIKNQNETITLINEGEVNRIRARGLTDITFKALLPAAEYPFAVYENGFRPIYYYLAKFEIFKYDEKPIRFIISRTGVNVLAPNHNMLVSLEDYTIEDTAGDGLDMSVTIHLKEYKYYGTKTLAVSEGVAQVSEARDTSEKVAAATHTVVSGDTLTGIAKKYFGGTGRWKEIYTLNEQTIEQAAKSRGRASSSNGHWIYPGTVLTLPA